MYDHKNSMMLSPVDASHLDALRDLKNGSWATTHQTLYLHELAQIEWYKSMDSKKNIYMIASTPTKIRQGTIHTEPGGDVGFLGVTDIDPVSQVAGVTASMFRGSKPEHTPKVWEAATDFAFEMQNIHRLECEVLSNNIVSLKLCLAVGFKLEGIRRQAVYKSGCYLDSYMLGLLRNDWENSERVKKMGGVCNINARLPNVSKMFEDGGVDLLPEELKAFDAAITALDLGRNRVPDQNG